MALKQNTLDDITSGNINVTDEMVAAMITGQHWRQLFVDYLGWDRGGLQVKAGDTLVFTRISSIFGLSIFIYSDDTMPNAAERANIAKAAKRVAHENILIFIAKDNKNEQIWRSTSKREIVFRPSIASNLVDGLNTLVFTLNDYENEHKNNITFISTAVEAMFKKYGKAAK